MTVAEVLEELKALDTEEYREAYRRQGVSGDLYGVSITNLRKLKKKLKSSGEDPPVGK